MGVSFNFVDDCADNCVDNCVLNRARPTPDMLVIYTTTTITQALALAQPTTFKD